MLTDFMLRAEFDPFLVVQHVGQIEVHRAVAGLLLAEFHQRAEPGDQFVEGIFQLVASFLAQ